MDFQIIQVQVKLIILVKFSSPSQMFKFEVVPSKHVADRAHWCESYSYDKPPSRKCACKCIFGVLFMVVELVCAAKQLKENKVHILRCISESVSSFSSQCYICKLDNIKIPPQGWILGQLKGKELSEQLTGVARLLSSACTMWIVDSLKKHVWLQLPP